MHFDGATRARRGDPSPLLDLRVHVSGTDTNLDVSSLKRLIRLADGKTKEKAAGVDVIVSAPNGVLTWTGDKNGDNSSPPVVTEQWLLDSISSWQRQPYANYKKVQ